MSELCVSSGKHLITHIHTHITAMDYYSWSNANNFNFFFFVFYPSPQWFSSAFSHTHTERGGHTHKPENSNSVEENEKLFGKYLSVQLVVLVGALFEVSCSVCSVYISANIDFVGARSRKVQRILPSFVKIKRFIRFGLVRLSLAYYIHIHSHIQSILWEVRDFYRST